MIRLAELRKEKGLSQKYVASFLGLTKQAVQRYEAGISEPTITNLKKMATYFNVTIDYLVGYSDER
ncbi:DNA-binding transcriptional regulator [Fructobacillus fructosus]|uniref:helix-turn-helix domain-containing protein n=1 Tax=Fructobacillus fructosus TaxID=1631 RepID=UPI002DA29993|nr:DNA-binding transcriptional regulator [Fructobacillus fructosus]